MRTTRKIALSGIHGGGKTTTVHALMAEFKAQGKICHMVEESARVAASRGFSLNNSADINSQLWIMNRGMETELAAEKPKPDFIFGDRPVIDVRYYAEVNPAFSSIQKELIKRMVDSWLILKPYDLVFVYKPLSTGAEVDEMRDMSKLFEENISNAIDKVLAEYPDLPIHHMVSTTKRERMAECINVVKEMFP